MLLWLSNLDMGGGGAAASTTEPGPRRSTLTLMGACLALLGR